MILPSLKNVLAELGIGGDVVCLHTSMRAFSPRIRTGDLIDTLGAGGTTLLAPAFTYHFEVPPPEDDQPPGNGMDYTRVNRKMDSGAIFDPAENTLSVSDMGALPLALLETPGRARGNHPLNSFVSLGELARELVCDQTATDVYAPFRALLEHAGKVLLIGTDTTSLTLVHYAEMLSGRELFIRWARNADGQVMRTRVGSCSAGFGALMPVLRDAATTATWQGARFIVADAAGLLDALKRAIDADPGITHCGRNDCLRCVDAIGGGPQS